VAPLASDTVDEALPNGGRLRGFCAPQFAAVRDVMRRNFAERGEIGASLCITHKGATLVDLWGGIADPATGKPWERDTICVVFSATKGAAALVAHMLVARGELSLDQDVCGLWPAFGQNGKAGTTLAMMLSHASPVPAFREPIKDDGPCDWDYMVARTAAEPAWWPPGSRQGYHGLSFAWTIGEMVRLASGRRLGALFREEVAEPLGLDFWIGLPAAHEDRVARLVLADFAEMDATTKFYRALTEEPGSLTQLVTTNTGNIDFNSRAVRAAEIPSANGVTNARGLAGLYTPLANGGGGLVDRDAIARMSRVVSASHEDACLLQPIRFALGFMATMGTPGSDSTAIIGDRAFGHVGMGGSIGFADPEAEMSFGYAMNRGGTGVLLNPRGQALVDAAYRSLGWSSNASGGWRR
jgi:CubicO group peptidase (beta-lactamase class C family)